MDKKYPAIDMVIRRCRTSIEPIIQPRTLMQTIRAKQLSGKKPMEQRLRVIQYITEYRVIKERNLHGSQNRLQREKTKGRDNRP